MKKNNKKSVIIMGAGLAGLAAGYELAGKGYKVIIFEKNPAVGGLSMTIKCGKHLFDTGPHRWYTKNNRVNNWMLKLMGKEIIKVPRLTRIYFDGKFFYYPIKILNALKGIGLTYSIRAVIDYIKARVSTRFLNPGKISMEDGYVNQFGRTLYEVFFKRYSEKLWGRPCNEISIDWVGQRTRGLSISTIIKEALFKSKTVVSLVDEFSYPEMGVGRISEKMAGEIKRRDGRIHLSCEVTKVNYKGNAVVSLEVKKNRKKETHRADYFISSVPLSDLVSRFAPKIPIDVYQASGKLKYRDELQVALFVKKARITPDTWIYIHPKEIPYMRLMEMDNWSRRLSPGGTTTVVFEIACNEGDKMWRKKDKDVIRLTAESYIKEFRWIRKEDITGGYVHRVPKEYPVYHIGYRKDLGVIKAFFRRFSNLQLVGRNGTFRYNNMDHSVEMGIYAAGNIIAGRDRYNIDSVNIEREYLEEKKLENIEDEALDQYEWRRSK